MGKPTKTQQIIKKDVNNFMDFLGHKTFWLHIFNPTIAGEYQKGELKSLFSTDRKKIIKEIEKFNGKGIICLATNQRDKGQTKGSDVKNLETITFDLDVRKELKVDYVSTDEHHKHAVSKAEDLKIELEKLGFCVGMKVDSGNGSQVYAKVKLDLKENKDSVVSKLILLENYLRDKFNDDIIELDCITKDINRRMKIPGTINKKDTEQKEDRIARIVYYNNIPLPMQENQNIEAFNSFNIVIDEPKQRTTLNCSTGELNKPLDKIDRSAFEFGKVCSFIKKGMTKQEVFNSMNVYSKWVEKGDSYKEMTYEKALKQIEEAEIEQAEEERLKPLDYRSLIDYKIEPISWLVENILPKGEVCILGGKRGDGKTWIADDIALGLASGTEVFGENVPEKKKVFIIDEEGGDNTQAERIQLLAKGRGIEDEELELMSMSFSGLKLDQPNSKKFLEFTEILKEFKPHLIIIDCLQRIVSIDIDKENAQISAMFTGIVRPLIKKYETGFLFIHHLRKSPTGNNSSSSDPLDEMRGGSETVNYARCVMSISQPRNQKKEEDGSMKLVFKILKMSNAPIIEPKVLIFQPDSPDQKLSTQIKINYLGKIEDVLGAEKQAANAIKEFLMEEQITGEFPTKLIIDNAKKIGFERTWLGKGLKELLDIKFLEKPKRGIYIVSDKKSIVKPKPSLKPKLPYGSPKKTIEEQKKDLVKTEDDINDEIIAESLRKKKLKELEGNPFCPNCKAPMVKNKCIAGCK